jgi:hypothetical protein
MPDVSHPTQEPPQLPSQGVRTLVSLLLFLHLFSLGVVFMSYGNPLGIEEQESLNRRLLDVLSPYVETFNLNLGHRYRVPTPPETAVEPTARYYLTHGKPTDVDFVVEIDARKKDGTAEKVTIPPSNLWPHQRYLRYQMLANAIGSLSGNDLMADNEGRRAHPAQGCGRGRARRNGRHARHDPLPQPSDAAPSRGGVHEFRGARSVR